MSAERDLKIRDAVIKWKLADYSGNEAMEAIDAILAAPPDPVAEVVRKLRYYGEVTTSCQDNPTRKLMRDAADLLAAIPPEQPAQTGGVYLNQAQLDALREVLRISDREHEAWRVVKDAIKANLNGAK